jgi:hypothetical protein
MNKIRQQKLKNHTKKQKEELKKQRELRLIIEEMQNSVN